MTQDTGSGKAGWGATATSPEVAREGLSVKGRAVEGRDESQDSGKSTPTEEKAVQRPCGRHVGNNPVVTQVGLQ
jgi:hypothetical protein